MPLKCPTCAQQYEQGLQCPRCRVSLIPWAQTDLDTMDPVPPHWTRNPWGRTVLGVILAQGIYLGLKNLLLAGYLAAEEQGSDAMRGYYHLFSTQALQLIALLIGSLFAGAGQKSGFLFGGLVGVWNAIILTLVHSFHGEAVAPVALYGLPIIHAAMGTFGGTLGAWVWKPPQLHAEQAVARRGPIALPLNKGFFSLREVKIHWLRILVGMAVVVAGIYYAEPLLKSILDLSVGTLRVKTPTEETFFVLELAALICFFGGMLAGGATYNGGVQGAWTGILAMSVLVGLRATNGSPEPVGFFALKMAAMLVLTFAGGFFGSKLLPPLAPKKVKRSLDAMTA